MTLRLIFIASLIGGLSRFPRAKYAGPAGQIKIIEKVGSLGANLSRHARRQSSPRIRFRGRLASSSDALEIPRFPQSSPESARGPMRKNHNNARNLVRIEIYYNEFPLVAGINGPPTMEQQTQ